MEVPISRSSANGAAADTEARIALEETALRIEELVGLRPGDLLDLPVERPAERVVNGSEQFEGRLAGTAEDKVEREVSWHSEN